MENQTITQAVSERYAKAVTTGEEMCCPTGYDHQELGKFIPEAVLKVSYGCGTPVGLTSVQAGETVLDIGSGGGIDCFEASRRVGPSGRVIGIDMTDEMLALARSQAPIVASNLGYASSNVDFRKGFADAMPVEDQCVDLIVSNCVINLAPDKLKVFQEMYRVLKPGGRFTISDIVADQPIPQYMIHDKEKWGDCLSGALRLSDYWGGLRNAGFGGIHRVGFIPWRVIDGIHFLSLTLTGYKLPNGQTGQSSGFATFKGPFSRVTDEQGQTYRRGEPQAVNESTEHLLKSEPYRDQFIFSENPVTLSTEDPRWSAVLPENTACTWEGHFALLTGPFVEAVDDDGHTFTCGEAIEICSKTLKVLDHDDYKKYFVIINRANETVSNDSSPSCGPTDSCC
ncbi:MAG: methyltransferase domain-containing protein [Nitrospirales bacterium]|nr:methyltransferase domain-containing protein [Nitrospira sp.]MDR4500688.1 methyltransferase domain-containing protein [Nitrospirales bacterium]